MIDAGGAFLFPWFAWKWEPRLLLSNLPIFLFTPIGAVATRWHDVIDLPVGIVLRLPRPIRHRTSA